VMMFRCMFLSEDSAAMHAWTRPRAQAWAAFVLLLLAGTTSAQSLTSQTFKSPTGESVKFLGDSVSLKYYPAASANCSQCYLAFKLGALSELDAVSSSAKEDCDGSSGCSCCLAGCSLHYCLTHPTHLDAHAVWATCCQSHHRRPITAGPRSHWRCVSSFKGSIPANTARQQCSRQRCCRQQ
jgi:hypothetical protein